MITYCATCKIDTESGDIMYVTTKNNRTMMKGKCNVCGRVKCQFAKTPPIRPEGLKNGGDSVGVFNTVTSKFKRHYRNLKVNYIFQE
jgi:hypothetical protein